MCKEYDEVIKNLDVSLYEILKLIPNNYKEKVREIRLRLNKPIVLVLDDGMYTVTSSGKLSDNFRENSFIVSKDLLFRSFNKNIWFFKSKGRIIIKDYFIEPN